MGGARPVASRFGGAVDCYLRQIWRTHVVPSSKSFDEKPTSGNATRATDKSMSNAGHAEREPPLVLGDSHIQPAVSRNRTIHQGFLDDSPAIQRLLDASLMV